MTDEEYSWSDQHVLVVRKTGTDELMIDMDPILKNTDGAYKLIPGHHWEWCKLVPTGDKANPDNLEG